MKQQSQRITSSQDLGKVLARARKSKGLSQRDVAAKLGVTQKWISFVEQGKSRAWIDKVLELAYFLEVRIYATEESPESKTDEPVSNINEASMDDLLRELGND